MRESRYTCARLEGCGGLKTNAKPSNLFDEPRRGSGAGGCGGRERALPDRRAPKPEHVDTARRVLTPTQLLTWEMAERGVSQRAIAYFRRVSPSTVRDCLAACDRAIERARGQGP